MALIVQKFGGTSVGDIERIKNIAAIIKAERERGNQVVVVVSAMSGVTDQLEGLVSNFSQKANDNQRQEYDTILSTGENVSSGLVALALMNLGLKARSWAGWQIPIITNEYFTQGKITGIDPTKIYQALENEEIPVIAGFQGVYEGRIVTLGRGGSDTSAAAIAAAINADRCDIYTDVEGVFTADPRKISASRKLDKITYGEMLEMASGGAKVLHPRSVEIAQKYDMNMQVRSSITPVEGTVLISDQDSLESQRITGVAGKNNLCLVKLECPKPQDALGVLQAQGVSIDQISQSHENGNDIFSVVMHESDEKILNKNISKNVGLEVVRDLAKVSLTGYGIQSSLDITQKLFQICEDRDINVVMLTTSETKVGILLEVEDCTDIVRDIHKAFRLDAHKEEK